MANTHHHPTYKRHRNPQEVIAHAVRLYHRFCLSFRDVEDLLAERGISVSYETIRKWRLKFGHAYARRIRRQRGSVGVTKRRLCLLQETTRDLPKDPTCHCHR